MGQIAFYGFGEAGQAFSAGLNGNQECPCTAYDLRAPELFDAAARLNVVMCRDPDEALRDAQIVFCLVTADQAFAAAKAAAPYVKSGSFWLDGNSCSPGSKRLAASIIESVDACYVDVAIMAPVFPKLLATPCLLGGPFAEGISGTLSKLGMDVQVSGNKVGDASAIKMLRSIMIKGLEALTAECLLAARHAGVEDKVLATLQASDPGFDWQQKSAYNLERMMVHGERRAAEMREVVVTLEELGLPHRMASATSEWQDQVGSLGLSGDNANLAQRADRILSLLT